MTETDYYAWYRNALYFRGLVINNTTVLEKSIDEYLAAAITNNREAMNDIYVHLLDRMTFEGKRTALEAILKKKNTKESYTRNYKKFIDDIRKTIYVRNYFAHYLITSDREGIDQNNAVVGLLEFRDSLVTHWFTQTKIDKFIWDTKLITDKLEVLINELNSN